MKDAKIYSWNKMRRFTVETKCRISSSFCIIIWSFLRTFFTDYLVTSTFWFMMAIPLASKTAQGVCHIHARLDRLKSNLNSGWQRFCWKSQNVCVSRNSITISGNRDAPDIWNSLCFSIRFYLVEGFTIGVIPSTNNSFTWKKWSICWHSNICSKKICFFLCLKGSLLAEMLNIQQAKYYFLSFFFPKFRKVASRSQKEKDLQLVFPHSLLKQQRNVEN